MTVRQIIRSRTYLLVLAALIIAVTPAGPAAEEEKTPAFSGHIKFEKFHSDFDVNSDGSYTMVQETVVCVLTDQGVKTANHASFSYSEGLDEASILWAYTEKKDGRRVDVPASNIQDREAVAGGGPMFSDIKSKLIIFPDVAVGDKVGYSFKFVRKTPLFPGNFSLTRAFTKSVVYDDVRIGVRVPKNSIDIKVLAVGVQGGPVEGGEGVLRWVWSYKNQEIEVPEYGSVDPIDYGPRIVASSFKDYGVIAQTYEDRAKPKAAVTDKVRALASELTAGVEDKREQAKILYNWVTKNIRFAGNLMGIGSVVPHDVDTILANRLGDCKDHTALFQALLAAAGIESTAVMINSGDTFKLPEVASSSVLNHIITYIPSLDLYADSSSEYTPFGQLPMLLWGKPAIHTANFDGIRKTPVFGYQSNQSKMKMVLDIHEDGSADGETNSEETGVFATLCRAAMARIQPSMANTCSGSPSLKGRSCPVSSLTSSTPGRVMAMPPLRASTTLRLRRTTSISRTPWPIVNIS